MNIGLWLGEVIGSAEYWLLRGASVGLRMFGVVRAHPVLAALTLITGAGSSFAAAQLHEERFYGMKRTATRDAKALINGIDGYRAEMRHLPARLEELLPNHVRDLHADPWGHSYAYYRGEGGYAVVSAGPDGILGTGDDVVVEGVSR
jgi:hypothetical protein